MELAAEARTANNAGAPEAPEDASGEHLQAEQRATAKANVNFYMDDFISVIQGGLRERRQMLRRLFHQIEQVF